MDKEKVKTKENQCIEESKKARNKVLARKKACIEGFGKCKKAEDKTVELASICNAGMVANMSATGNT